MQPAFDIGQARKKFINDVVRDAETMLDALALSRLNFEGTYQDAQGKARKCYHLPRDLTMTLVTGYSIPLRKKVIDRLEQLEGNVRAFEVPQTYAAALRLASMQAEKLEEQNAVIEIMTPKSDFFDAFMNADGIYTLQNAGRSLNLRPNLFIRWLKSKYLFYQGGDLVPYIQYRQMDIFEVKSEVGNDDKSHLQTFITPKGLAYFDKRVPDNIRVRAA